MADEQKKEDLEFKETADGGFVASDESYVDGGPKVGRRTVSESDATKYLEGKEFIDKLGQSLDGINPLDAMKQVTETVEALSGFSEEMASLAKLAQQMKPTLDLYAKLNKDSE